jgi:hypothetical protein
MATIRVYVGEKPRNSVFMVSSEISEIRRVSKWNAVPRNDYRIGQVFQELAVGFRPLPKVSFQLGKLLTAPCFKSKLPDREPKTDQKY